MPDDHPMWILVFWSCESVMVALFQRVIMKRLRLGANIFENSNDHASALNELSTLDNYEKDTKTQELVN